MLQGLPAFLSRMPDEFDWAARLKASHNQFNVLVTLVHAAPGLSLFFLSLCPRSFYIEHTSIPTINYPTILPLD